MGKIPKYLITIDEEYGDNLGWTKTAFTKNPAIRIKGMAFSSDEPVAKLSFKDDLKYRIAAPAMLPSTIYRNQDGEEFYVEFTEKEIERIHKKFMKEYSQSNKSSLFNLEHSEEEVPAYMLECWMVENPKLDKSYTTFGIEVPKGTLFMVAQVTDKDYYANLVKNEQTGFSIEGFLGLAIELSENNNNELEKTQTKMEKEFILPEGTKFNVGEKWYIVKDGTVIEYKEEEVMAEEVITEEKVEEKVELAEEVVTEEVVTEEVVTEVKPEYYTKEEVDAKFDEIYKLIASLQVDDVEIEEEKIEEVKLSIADKLSAFSNFSRKNK